MKKAIKNTAKVTKPKYTIDMRNFDDVAADFLSMKIENGMPLTYADIDTIKSIIIDSLLRELLPEDGTAIVRYEGVCNKCTAIKTEAKKPWYKRLWNWITRKK